MTGEAGNPRGKGPGRDRRGGKAAALLGNWGSAMFGAFAFIMEA